MKPDTDEKIVEIFSTTDTMTNVELLCGILESNGIPASDRVGFFGPGTAIHIVSEKLQGYACIGVARISQR